jgi:hypothetical protein
VSTRLQHSLRFAIATLVAVYAIGVLWEVVDMFFLERIASADAEELVTFNERVWRSIAIAEAVAVFLLRLGDVHTAPPTWGFAWGSAAWLGFTSVVALVAIEEQYWWTAGLTILAAIGLWLSVHHRFRGWPGAHQAPVSGQERELH